MKTPHIPRRRRPPLVVIPRRVEALLRAVGRVAERAQVRAYAVGGCVRDWWLGKQDVTDLDIAIEGDGVAFAKQLARVLRARLTVHEQFGTATLELPASWVVASRRPSARTSRAGKRARQNVGAGRRIDIATCRKEVYATPAAYPKVMAGTLREDLFRRDFTINAMAVAIHAPRFGELVDPFHGSRDLKTRRLRILHRRSFIDDPSRILRAVRFAQRFGLRLDPATARCLKAALADGAVTRLNRGRLRKELERMIQEPNPHACLVRLGQWLSLPNMRPVTGNRHQIVF